MSELIKLRQGTGGVINIQHAVDGVPIAGLQAAKYMVFDRNNVPVLTLTLGNGISWSGGLIVITITAAMADSLSGLYINECAVIDAESRDLIVLDGQIQFQPRKVRI